MADDIVTRLRTVDEFSDAIGIMGTAADEIERLRNELAAANRLLEIIDKKERAMKNLMGRMHHRRG